MLPRLQKRWEIRESLPAGVDQALAGYPPFFRQILYARGVQDDLMAGAYLYGQAGNDDPFQLTDMQTGVDRLLWAIDHQESIAVYGDYDVDGVTATALLTQVLRQYGARVTPYIPNRFEEGYGLNVEALEGLAADGVQVVVTVDCGIRSPGEAARAAELGIDLLICDHHHPGDVLPDAWSVICPKRPEDQYPDKDLAGVGLAYKIAQAMAARRPEAGVNPEAWLDLVALGTVADVVPLRGENRVLVRRGLEQMSRSSRTGLISLANVAGIRLQKASAGDIGFVLGPRLNAAGRLDTARDSLQLLMCEDIMEAGRLAQKLDNQNRQRQELTRQMQEEAIRLAQSVGAEDILFAFSPNFNPGVVGLAASRLVDTYYRPAVVGEVGPETTRASCRSIPEFHITDALDECKDLLVRHGGHALAAGFTVRNENVPELIERLRAVAARKLGGLELRPVLRADLEIPLCDLRAEFLRFLDMLQPTGQDNAEALFVSRGLQVVRYKPVGSEGQHLRLTVRDGSIYYDGIAFRQGYRAKEMPGRVDVLFAFEKNEFNGRESLQLNIRDFKAAGTPD
jgi:single-stranded-DNA-specific exonuclease